MGPVDPMSQSTSGAARRSMLHRLLLRLPAETSHNLALAGLQLGQALGTGWLRSRFQVRDERLSQEWLGELFPNPVGLAAGFDKDGLVVPGMEALGFGFVEVGTVTPRRQEGNPRPRLFRHPQAATLENAMGFNNRGAEQLARRLRRGREAGIPVGVNIGKAKKTPNHDAREDYTELAAVFDGLCDYLVVNVSSPNTPGLRDLQTLDAVRMILGACRERTSLPLLVKLSPDLEDAKLVELAVGAVAAGAAGVILTNTTTDYELMASARRIGGLSGAVLRRRSHELLRAVASELFGKCLLISVGGVDSGAEAYRRLRSGAGLVQLYSALVFQGPRLVSSILRDLLELAERDGFSRVSDAVGADL